MTARASSGLQAATVFAFSAQTTNLTAGAVTYRWDFGDGATSTDAAPTRVFSTAGRYTVVLTASDGRQSARAETVVTVHALTGGWISSTGRTTMQLTQSGTAVTGTVSLTASVEGNAFPNCPISGSVRADAPVVVLIRPVCRHATLNLQLVQGEFRMDLDAEGQALSGTITEPAPYGTNPANFRRQ
ncbi:MAG: PKD domain-containing protein [Acidobacteria bacterium]|nr:PKD domain-containing protein [Acidobacteriota bacterium]